MIHGCRPFRVRLAIGTFAVLAVLAGVAAAQDHLRFMPSAREVLRTVSGKDAVDTAARQAGAFRQLTWIVREMCEGGEFASNCTPAENAVMEQYSRASVDVHRRGQSAVGAGPGWHRAVAEYDNMRFRLELLDLFSPQLKTKYMQLVNMRAEQRRRNRERHARGQSTREQPPERPRSTGRQYVVVDREADAKECDRSFAMVDSADRDALLRGALSCRVSSRAGMLHPAVRVRASFQFAWFSYVLSGPRGRPSVTEKPSFLGPALAEADSLAKIGHADGMSLFGTLHLRGGPLPSPVPGETNEIVADSRVAEKWCTKGANAGSPYGMACLAELYSGRYPPVAANARLAATWASKADRVHKAARAERDAPRCYTEKECQDQARDAALRETFTGVVRGVAEGLVAVNEDYAAKAVAHADQCLNKQVPGGNPRDLPLARRKKLYRLALACAEEPLDDDREGCVTGVAIDHDERQSAAAQSGETPYSNLALGFGYCAGRYETAHKKVTAHLHSRLGL